jgi:hypothetical protein
MSKSQIANVLIGLGVLAWAPFLWQLARGGQPGILPYLAVHLAGVLSGAWLRARRGGGGQGQPFGHRRILASKIMIYLGVLAWAPYFYLSRVAAADVDMSGFLAAHLTGVLGGAALRGSVEVARFAAGRQDASDDSG